jgi:hypothetical protein
MATEKPMGAVAPAKDPEHVAISKVKSLTFGGQPK